jgi:hypothetical protein
MYDTREANQRVWVIQIWALVVLVQVFAAVAHDDKEDVVDGSTMSQKDRITRGSCSPRALCWCTLEQFWMQRFSLSDSLSSMYQIFPLVIGVSKRRRFETLFLYV